MINGKKIQNSCKIIEVYEHNFIKEIKRLSSFLDEYPLIALDTEFPGTVYQLSSYQKEFYYRSIKINVDSLKLIQVGITLCDEEGNYPPNGGTWQFNLKFDIHKDPYSYESLTLLVNSGINFEQLRVYGIPHSLFAEYLVSSGLVLNSDVQWISFHGISDFAYLLKLVTNSVLPKMEEQFYDDMAVYFPHHYDIRILVKSKTHLKGGLNKLAQFLSVLRVGETHQAGSDSIVTAEVFFKLRRSNLLTPQILSDSHNVLFGVGKGADDNETLSYTFFGNTTNSFPFSYPGMNVDISNRGSGYNVINANGQSFNMEVSNSSNSFLIA